MQSSPPPPEFLLDRGLGRVVVPEALRAAGAVVRTLADVFGEDETPWTRDLWIYDFRTNQHFTLKEHPLRREDLDGFVACYHPEDRHNRSESERFRRFTYEELLQREKVSLDIFWLRDESLDDGENLPAPEVLAAEIVDDLEAALAEFAQIAESLAGPADGGATG